MTRSTAETLTTAAGAREVLAARSAPTVTLFVFAYNHEAFIEEALAGALAQTYEPLEIIVTDDCSTDRTAAIIQRVLAAYGGPKRTRFVQSERNGGLASVINNVTSLAQGEIMIMAAGDDRSAPDRAAQLAEAYASDASIFCVYSNANVIGTTGDFLRVHYSSHPPEKSLLAFAKPRTGLLGATASYRREVFEKFGPLSPDLVSEDWVLPLRAAILGGVVYLDRPLVDYRVHGANLSMALQPKAVDLEGWLTLARRGASRAVAILENRARDLDTGLALFPGKRRDLQRVQRATRLFLMRSKAERELYTRPSIGRRAWLTAKVLLLRGDRRVAWHWMQSLFPQLGYRLSRRRTGEAK